MFTRFEKAETRRARRSGGMMLSVAAHAALVWLAAVATVRGTEPPPPEPPPPLVYLPPRPEPQPLPEATPGTTSPSPSGAAVAREPRPPVRIIDAPAFVPPELPPIADGAPSALDDAIEIGREAIGAGPAAGSASGSGLPGAGGVWSGPMVEVEARARPGNPAPRYPRCSSSAGQGDAWSRAS